ncbi:UNVERIFIED_CONTAM: hypothetical protein Slati_0145200 [Sesamum latifolium]|uniref:Uncharacterized protein n=1 Tax=Sesamum latifolium TaxID=2727402 RepID=A0AAW2YAB3_9LAMI
MATNQTEAAETAAARMNRQVIPESLQLHGLDHVDLEQSYFTNLVKLWEELEVLMPTPQCTCNGCTCGASKAVADLASFTQLMHFLMGLGNEFDHVRNQLLVMDPTPNVNKAYAIVLSVERQREVNMELHELVNATAMAVRGGFKKEDRRRGHTD